MIRFRSIAVLFGALALTACEKNAVQDITGALPESRVKFFNFGVSAPSVHFYANDTKVTATTSAVGRESVAGIASGGVGSGGLYSRLDPGEYTFTSRLMDTLNNNKGVVIASVPGALATGRAYSMYVSGIYNTTARQADGFIVEDDFPEAIDYSVAHVRFVNAISNANPMRLVIRDQTAGSSELPIGDVVAYKAGSAFVAVTPGVYDLYARYAGATANVITRTGVGFSGGFVYTIGARGDITVTSTTAATRPQLDNARNR
jgi:hypothetical protein